MSNGIHGSQPVLQHGVPIADADNVIIVLHGRGGSARDVLSLGEALASNQSAVLAPQAAGGTWYPLSFLAPREQNEPNLSSALAKIGAIVQDVLDVGVPSDKIVLCGFSQGACLATEFVASHPRRYKGLVAFTGGLIGSPGSDLTHSGDLAGTPAFLGAGDPDPHVPWKRVEESATILRAMGAEVTLKRYPGLPHTVSLEEIQSARVLLGL